MTLLYTDSRFLDHDTGGHPESAARLLAVTNQLEELALTDLCERPCWKPATLAQLCQVHGQDHLARLRQTAEQGGGQLDPDTIVSPASEAVARLAAGAACDAVDRVTSGPHHQALCLVRPPGHHALAQRAMGFCLMNNIAIATSMAAQQCQVDHMLIVDWDVHHGNGTQDIFYEDPRVGFFSVHRWPFYPGTGAGEETGHGLGLGTTHNVPVPFGIRRSQYVQVFKAELEKFAARIKPELVLISAGFDSHREDPVGSLGLEVEDFVELTNTVLEVARTYANGRLVSVLEGGYHPQRLAECVEVHLQTLLQSDQHQAGAKFPA